MSFAAIDACCLIDLLASGNADGILRANGLTWHLPSAVQAEIRYCRQYDPTIIGKVVTAPADLSGLISSNVLTICSPQNQQESDRFIHYAAQFRSDGEAMCVAIAEQRGWAMATDDRKAIRVAKQAGVPVVSCPELVKVWAVSTGPDPGSLTKMLLDIQVLAQFKPNSSLPEYQWWVDQLAQSSP